MRKVAKKVGLIDKPNARKVCVGHSPFKPDREHLHHICERIGLSPLMTLFIIRLLVSICATVGIVADLNGVVGESTIFVAFLVMFAVYFTAMSHIWQITTWIKNLSQKNKKEIINYEF